MFLTRLHFCVELKGHADELDVSAVKLSEVQRSQLQKGSRNTPERYEFPNVKIEN